MPLYVLDSNIFIQAHRATYPLDIDEFLEFDNADAWLIVYCKSKGDTLVTQEVSNPEQKRRIPIPEPCNHFGVNYCDMITMFRSLGVQF